MTLPSAGSEIKFSQIQTELSGSGQQSLSAAGVTLASITAGNRVRTSADLGGTSAGSTIVVDYNDTITEPASNYYYRELTITGRNTSDVISVTFNYSYTEIEAGKATIYSSINSTSVWDVEANLLNSGSGSFTVTDIDNNDVVRIRLYLTFPIPGLNRFYCNIDSAAITTGSGTISVSGTTGWAYNYI